MGLVQGESMAARFFHRLGASLLDRTICASAGGEALVPPTAARSACRWSSLPRAKLILIWGSNSIASNLHFWPCAAGQAQRRQAGLHRPARTETADKCHEHIACARHRRRAGAGLMHELIATDWLDHDYIARHRGLGRCASARCSGRPSARRQVCGITAAEQMRRWRATIRTTQPAAIRLNYGMQRVRGGGNAVRLVALLPCLTGAWRHRAGGCCCQLGLVPGAWTRAALQRPDLLAGRRPRTINMSTIGDDLLREGSPGFGPIEALVVYNSNPVAVAPESAKVVQGFAREDLFTVVLEHFRPTPPTTPTTCCPPPRSWSTGTCTQLRPHRCAAQPPGHRAAGPGQAQHADLPRAGARMGFDDPALPTATRTLCRQALWCSGGLRRNCWHRALPRCRCPTRRLPGRLSPPSGKCEFFSVNAWPPGPGRPARPRAQPRVAAGRPSWQRYPLAMISPPARNFLNSSFVNVPSLRSIEGASLCWRCTPTTRPRAACQRRCGAGVQRPGQLPLPRQVVSARAARRGQRPGGLVAQAGAGRHQRQPAHQPGPDRPGRRPRRFTTAW
jgi:anaerobic selenocysteine-containing dehydrogenase